mmetsp:Transcript_25638/g.60411  ORF Transcript_25638/g.60411 Transcript_25638/m.60411 type:complete len:82 (+) Transcript_25638:187-432(+)
MVNSSTPYGTKASCAQSGSFTCLLLFTIKSALWYDRKALCMTGDSNIKIKTYQCGVQTIPFHSFEVSDKLELDFILCCCIP